MNRLRPILIVATLLFFWLAMDSMVDDSPTMDEQNHLARGLAFLRTGDPRLSLEHPPLVNTLSTLPLLTLPEIRLPTDHPSWTRPQGWYEFAELLLWQYNDDVTRMIFLARIPIIFLTLALALTGYVFGNSIWGRPAGHLVYFTLLFDPNLLAHGRYTTTDLGGTLFVFLAAFLVWRAWQIRQPGPKRLLWAGVGLGLAYSSKLSALVFAPIFALLSLLPIYHHSHESRHRLRRVLRFGALNIVALVVVWACFGFQWGAMEFSSPLLSPLNGIEGPMPTFWAGVEQILLLSGGGRPSFLLGETSSSGFTAYFPVAFLAKTPVATHILLVLALVVLVIAPRHPADRQHGVFLLLPALIYFLVSMQSGLNIGYRHLLPVLPFIYVAGAGAATRVIQSGGSQTVRTPWQPVRWLAMAAIFTSLLASTLLIHPHYLSYFNIVSGGPLNGYRILVDSNVDWGQDLFRLQKWLEDNEISTLHLSWFGTADPTYYGMQYEPLPGLPRHFDLWWDVPFDPQSPPPGVYAISVSNIWELPLQDEKVVFPWFRAREPDARVAHSILIYVVE